MRPDTSHNYLPETSVYHWREVDSGNKIAKPGWYCQVFPKNDKEFNQWMSSNCPMTQLTWRFNNGSPYYEVYISNELEASTFALKWL